MKHFPSPPWLAAGFLVVLYVAVIAAPFVAPYGPDHQARHLPYAPPMALHFHHPEHGWQLRPWVYPTEPVEGTFDAYREDRSRPTPLRFFVTDASGKRHLFAAEGDVHVHFLGTDGFGRDLLSRLLFAGRISLATGLLAALLSLALGTLVGSLAGYFGGWFDGLAMRGCELLMALPWLYLLLAARAFLPLDIEPDLALGLTMGLIACLGWAPVARLIRGTAASLRQRDFVRAAEGFGAPHHALLWHHILPHTRGVMIVQLYLTIPRYILAEVTLSFLGLGMAEPHASWGTLLADAASYQVLHSYSWLLFPACALILVVLSYHQLANFHERRPGSVVS